MSSHGGAVAAASPYLGSIFPVVMLNRLGPGRQLIGLQHPIRQARARANRQYQWRAKVYQHPADGCGPRAPQGRTR